MKKPLASTLFAALCAAALPGLAGDGRVAFTGAIVERTCPLREARLDCPANRQVSAIVRSLNITMDRRDTRAGLLAYALARSPAIRWRLVEVVYR